MPFSSQLSLEDLLKLPVDINFVTEAVFLHHQLYCPCLLNICIFLVFLTKFCMFLFDLNCGVKMFIPIKCLMSMFSLLFV